MIRKILTIAVLAAVLSCKSDKNEEEDSYVIPAGNERASETEEIVEEDADIVDEASAEEDVAAQGDGELGPEVAESIERGAEIYGGLCITCHLASGQGIPGTFPPLDDSNWLTEKRLATIHAVKFGLQGAITVNGTQYQSFMPDPGLDDQEVADVLNYVGSSWSNELDEPYTLEEVQAVEQ